MRDVKELLFFMLSFIPWLLFLVIPIDSLSGLKLVIGICFSASVVFGFNGLKNGMILSGIRIIGWTEPDFSLELA